MSAMKAVHPTGRGGKEFNRLLLAVRAVVMAAVVAAASSVSESAEPPAPPAAGTPPQTVAQSAPVAPAGPSTTTAATPAGPSSGAKPDAAAGQPVANKPGRKILVDDTVTDAQLKQILRKGYTPEQQARGNEVYYCRRERELGSRFETKVCRTAARILLEEQQGKEATTNVERTGGNPVLK
jgi:hypothetical protein